MNSAKPKIRVVGEEVTTTSLAIAEHFGKNHFDVLKAIKNAIVDLLPASTKAILLSLSTLTRKVNPGPCTV